MPILIDFHPYVISSVAVVFNKKDYASKSIKTDIKQVVIKMILKVQKKFSSYGEVILCTDAKTYWRKNVFPYYKGNRKEQKDNSDLNWDVVHEVIDELKVELKEHFKYKIIEADGAEADDVIAVLTKHFATIPVEGFDRDNEVLIVAGDGDFFQLQKYGTVKQWSPRFNKFLAPSVPLKDYMIEHIVRASDDGIPNILSGDNYLVDKIRQHSIKKPYLQKFLEHGKAACTTDLERRNWDRNQQLIDFDFIPEHISTKILDIYTNYEVKGNRKKIMDYIIKSGMVGILDDLSTF